MLDGGKGERKKVRGQRERQRDRKGLTVSDLERQTSGELTHTAAGWKHSECWQPKIKEGGREGGMKQWATQDGPKETKETGSTKAEIENWDAWSQSKSTAAEAKGWKTLKVPVKLIRADQQRALEVTTCSSESWAFEEAQYVREKAKTRFYIKCVVTEWMAGRGIQPRMTNTGRYVRVKKKKEVQSPPTYF